LHELFALIYLLAHHVYLAVLMKIPQLSLRLNNLSLLQIPILLNRIRNQIFNYIIKEFIVRLIIILEIQMSKSILVHQVQGFRLFIS
jgi:hypothetical protein